jgi:hypothetical protein
LDPLKGALRPPAKLWDGVRLDEDEARDRAVAEADAENLRGGSGAAAGRTCRRSTDDPAHRRCGTTAAAERASREEIERITALARGQGGVVFPGDEG